MSILLSSASGGLVVMQTPNPGVVGVFSASLTGLDGTTLGSTATIGYVPASAVNFYPLFAFANMLKGTGTVTTGPVIEIGYGATANLIVAGTTLATTSGTTVLALAAPIFVCNGSPSFNNVTATVKTARVGTAASVVVKVFLIGVFA